MTHARDGAHAKKPRAHRLAPEVRPSEYRVHLELDPTRSARYRGTVEIDVALASARREIELHAVDLGISQAAIGRGGETRRAKVSERVERECIALQLDEPLPAGRATLRLAFSGKLRGDLRGLYAARSGDHRYAVTQLEATDARRFFPCFDEPALKARLTLRVTTRDGLAVLSNAKIARTERANGRQTVHFETTPVLSTYLYALAVGALECSEAARVGPAEIRIWHVPGKGGLTGFALEAARECLSRLEQYFDLPYPYAKLDLVAVPDFEFGAMENAGAVFFRETLLLLDPATATHDEKKAVAEVICHELAHMWYGNLVTMAWWDDLWLNESFATWMAFQIVDGWRPEWKMWNDFQHGRAAALGLDALAHTHPIYVEVNHPVEASENFDLITYEKGASVVRMLERWLGPTAFRAGVRRYIRRHRESNTRAADLWSALEAASKQPVERVVRGWIEQEGHPLLGVRRANRDAVDLRQERFVEGRSRLRAKQRWPIPFVARVGTGRGRATRVVRALFDAERLRVPLGGEASFVYGNADEGAFLRVLHDAEALAEIARALPALAPVERMGLVSHQWACVRAGHAGIGSFLDLVGALGRETEADVLAALRGPLASLDDRIARPAGPELRRRTWDFLVETFGEQLARLGWEAAPGEDHDTRLRRAQVIAILGLGAEWEPVVEAAQRRCQAYLDDRTRLDADLVDPVVAIAARHGDTALWQRMRSAMDGAATPQERRRFLLALAEFRGAREVERTLSLAATSAVKTQDLPMLLGRALANEHARERTWEVLRKRWSALEKRLPSLLITRVVEALPALGTQEHRREVVDFFRRHPLPQAKRTLLQALERFDLDASFRRRAIPELRAWAEERRSRRES